MKASGMLVTISFLMWVLTAQVCLSPNILHCHFNLHIFLNVSYPTI